LDLETKRTLPDPLAIQFSLVSTKRVVIAIDGPAGSGKSTIARRIADKLGFTYIDTGAMYRAVALWALRQDMDLTDMHRLEQLALAADIGFEPASSKVFLNGEDVSGLIRTPQVAQASSQVAVMPGVRRALVEKQRALGAHTSVVMEGRDIGSVVFPNAQVKIFLDADAAVRAERRLRELATPGGDNHPGATAEAVAQQMRERDQRDRTRAEAPLVQAPDALYLDSSSMSADEVEQAILKVIRDRVSNGKELG
jgi:CMP/dCMP kinase